MKIAINYAIFALKYNWVNNHAVIMSKVELEKVTSDKESSFKAAIYEDRFFTAPLHFHPEFELVIIMEGDGLCFCGDYIGALKPGDIMLFGKGLPHFCLSDKRYYELDSTEKCKSIYIQFREEILPFDFKQMPGFKNIQHILNLSVRGLLFSSTDYPEATSLICNLPSIKGFEKVIALYTILNSLAKEKKYNYMASMAYEIPYVSKDIIYLKIIDYINLNYKSEITLSQIAENVGMNKSALCRYFKKIQGKSIFDYINEFRISYACKLIANTDIRISTIAYDSGFNNISHFNNQFKIVTGYSPTAYRQAFLNL